MLFLPPWAIGNLGDLLGISFDPYTFYKCTMFFPSVWQDSWNFVMLKFTGVTDPASGDIQKTILCKGGLCLQHKKGPSPEYIYPTGSKGTKAKLSLSSLLEAFERCTLLSSRSSLFGLWHISFRCQQIPFSVVSLKLTIQECFFIVVLWGKAISPHFTAKLCPFLNLRRGLMYFWNTTISKQ